MRASGKGGQPERQELGQCYARDGYGVGLLTADQPERQVQGNAPAATNASPRTTARRSRAPPFCGEPAPFQDRRDRGELSAGEASANWDGLRRLPAVDQRGCPKRDGTAKFRTDVTRGKRRLLLPGAPKPRLSLAVRGLKLRCRAAYAARRASA